MSRSEIQLTVRNLHRCLVQAMDDRLHDRKIRAARAGQLLGATTSARIRARTERLGALSGRLNALSPLATLERGYAVARDASGTTLSSVTAFGVDQPFILRVRDGDVEAVTRSVTRLPERP